jgi:hypothetical protein
MKGKSASDKEQAKMTVFFSSSSPIIHLLGQYSLKNSVSKAPRRFVDILPLIRYTFPAPIFGE